MKSMFSSEFFAGNRARLRQAVGGDLPIVVTANGLLQRGADSTFPFAQDASFWYLTGIDEPDITLVMAAGGEFLIVPARDTTRATFDGSVDEALLTAHSGIIDVQSEADGWKRLDSLLATAKAVATPLAAPLYIAQAGMYPNPARHRLSQRLKKFDDLPITDIRVELAHLRMIKQPAELAAIQKAIDITAETLTDILSGDRGIYQTEYQLEAAVTQGFRSRGAAGHAFEPIVAGGERACTLHNVANNSPLAGDELVVIDVGAEYQHYAADITRTISLAQPSERQQAVYDAVLDVQQYAMGLLKPGVLLKEYEQQVADCMGKALQHLGLVKKPDHNAVRRYFPHATSHFMGLNVHDVGDYKQPLKEGMVLTVEPGIYIAEEAIGIRIEDDVLVTKDGIMVLSERLPRALR